MFGSPLSKKIMALEAYGSLFPIKEMALQAFGSPFPKKEMPSLGWREPVSEKGKRAVGLVSSYTYHQPICAVPNKMGYIIATHRYRSTALHIAGTLQKLDETRSAFYIEQLTDGESVAQQSRAVIG